MYRIFFFACLLAAISFVSCSKDDEPKDPCDGIVCLNGQCINGVCDCPPQYTGADCSDQKEPQFIRITNIVVTRFPEVTVNGSDWDVFSSRPDIYPAIGNANNQIIYVHPTFIDEALGSNDYSFAISPPVEISEVKSSVNFYLYDNDGNGAGSGDDFLGGIVIQLYNDFNGFPNTITLDAGGSVAFELSLTYVF